MNEAHSLLIHSHPSSYSTHHECILFPTYALKDPKNTNEWIIKVAGWAISFNRLGPKQMILQAITKSIAGKNMLNPVISKSFESKFKYFLAKGKRDRPFMIEAIGVSHVLDWINADDSNTLYEFPLIDSTSYINLNHHSHVISSKPSDLMIFLRMLNYNNPISMLLNNGSFSSDNTTTSDEESDDSSTISSIPMHTQQSIHNTMLRSEETGLFAGEFRIPEEMLIQESGIKSTHLHSIKIKSTMRSLCCNTPNKFPPSYGFVDLIDQEGISVISDIDDTIKHTSVLSGARTVLQNTFFNPSKAVPGMAHTYRTWHQKGASFHYVSNSPYQLVSTLCTFMHNHQFPKGSMHLQTNTSLLSKLSITPNHSKRNYIHQIINDFPHRKFILIGDSSELDLEIYSQIALDFPDQILKIFIRDVTSADSGIKKDFKKKITKTSKTTTAFATLLDLRGKHYPFDKLPVEDPMNESIIHNNNELLDNTRSRLAEIILEPCLTGHEALLSDTGLHNLTCYAQPTHQDRTLFYARLLQAKNRLKDIDIYLFKDAKELDEDGFIMRAFSTIHNKGTI
ncbi:hypothetical protein BDB01DRAFT_847288 [Pilobolus umbonatus]|nr:hypothetical protein BDB01DRAFT_847288 [Pilobolus umbonatus]